MKKVLCVLLCALLSLSVCNAQESTSESVPSSTSSPTQVPFPEDAGFRYEGNGFDTPEDAVLYYMAGLRNLNFEQMLHAFAWETQAEHYDFTAQLTSRQGYNPFSAVPAFPFSDELTCSANIEVLRGAQADLISAAVAYYMNPEDFTNPGGSVFFNEETDIDAFLQCFNPARLDWLTTMTDIRFYAPDDVTGNQFSAERKQKSFQRQISVYGADEVRNIVAVADIGNETLAVAPTVARYGDRWYLVSAGSYTADLVGIQNYQMKAFCILPDDLKTALNSLTPSRTASLPDDEFSAFRYERDGFGTPEQAIVCYLEGLKNRNVKQMLSAFAWETQSASYSLKDYILEVKTIRFGNTMVLPPLNSFMASADLCELRYLQMLNLDLAIRTYITGKTAMELVDPQRGQTVLKTEEEINDFLQLFENDRSLKLADMKNIRALAPETLIPSISTLQFVPEYLERCRQIYGADEVIDLIGIAELEGETLFCNPLLARYGDRWYIASTSGATHLALTVVNPDIGREVFLTFPGTLDDIILLFNR